MDYIDELLAILDQLRTDKDKVIRSAAQETVKLMKEINGDKNAGYGHEF